MVGWTNSVVMLASVVAGLAVATRAAAEWFTDLHLGGAAPAAIWKRMAPNRKSRLD